MRLNIGCGYDIRRGYTNCDIRDIEGVTQGDVSDSEHMSQFRDVDEILAYDILEHFPRAKARECLKLWTSLLSPGGVIKVRTPELRHAVKVAPNDEWLELLIYGGQDYEENFHKCGFTKDTLKSLLVNLGMTVTRSELSLAGNVEIWATK